MGWFTKKSNRLDRIGDGFHMASGTDYLKFLSSLHEQMKPGWYLEVGTETGRSLALVRGNAIAVDPQFKIATDLHYPARLHMFQQTSDDFFASRFLQRNDISIDVSFLDGMHHFEFLLRDFMNTERASKRESLVFMHDCIPFNHMMAERNWDKEKSLSWTGDVWKLLPILKRHRPDLKLEVLDCAPTALVLISDLDPTSTVLEVEYDSILKEWTQISLPDFGIERLQKEFPFVSAENWLKAHCG